MRRNERRRESFMTSAHGYMQSSGLGGAFRSTRQLVKESSSIHLQAEDVIKQAMDGFKREDRGREAFVPFYQERNKLGRSTIKEVANLVTKEGQRDKIQQAVERAKAKCREDQIKNPHKNSLRGLGIVQY